MRCTSFSGADVSQATFQQGTVTPIVTTDFSCRLDLTGATLNLTSFLLTHWRHLDLTGEAIHGLAGATLSTAESPLDLSGARLNRAALSQVVLDGANLGCAAKPDGSLACTEMRDAVLSSASLKKAVLVDALVQGANLTSANLDGANLCGAKLNKSPQTEVSATLQGAYLKNANLAQADLTGAILADASFYSSFASGATCLPAPNCGFTAGCASAIEATLTNARFGDAYLNGANVSGATLQSADFNRASLVGVNFTGANLSQDLSTGVRTDLSDAALQGATFTNANVEGATFAGARIDLVHASGATVLSFVDPTRSIAFPGYHPWPGSTLGCVEFTYAHPTTVPATDGSNVCPDGQSGPCSAASWQPALTPPALPPTCSTTTADLNWILD